MEITENSSSDEEIEPKSSSSQTQTHPPSYLEGLSVNQQIEVLYSEVKDINNFFSLKILILKF